MSRLDWILDRWIGALLGVPVPWQELAGESSAEGLARDVSRP